MMRPVATGSSAWSGEPALVGRREERALLRRLLREAVAARPAMAVVTGPPGVGKTALLRWLTTEGSAAGAFILHAAASGTLVPFATVRRLLAPLPGISPTVGGSELAAMAAEALTGLARRCPVLVQVDDVHDLEPESAGVLDELLTALDDAGTRQPLRLLAALTARDRLDGGEGLVDRLLRLGSSSSLPLGGLDEHELFELLAERGHRPDAALVRRLIEVTGGLPLLVESEVAGWRSSGQGSAVSLARPARVLSLTDAIGRQLGDVVPATRALLQRAALLGEPWTPDDLALVADLPLEDVEAAVDGAAGARLVRSERDGVRFSHPLVRSGLLDRMSTQRQRSLHRAIAARLMATAGGGEVSDERLVRAVEHLLRGQPGTPPDTLAEQAERAGQVAMEWGAWHQASWFLTAAADASAAAQPAAHAEIARGYLAAGRAAYLDHDGASCERSLRRAIAHARRVGDGQARLRAATFLARQRGGAHHRPGERIDLSELEEALEGAHEEDPHVVVEAKATLAEMLIISGETERALAIIESARDAAGGRPPPEAEAALGRVDFAEGIHRLSRLELGAAVLCLTRGQRRAAAAGDALTEVHTRSRLALTQLLAGAVSQAREALFAVEEMAAGRGFWAEVGLAAAQRAFIDTLAGRPTALGGIEQALGHWRRTGFPYIAALLAPATHALGARTRGVDRNSSTPVLPSLRHAELPVTSAAATLAAIDAHDVAGARAHLGRARWRSGFRGPVTQNRAVVAVALTEVGDLLDEADLVRSARIPLEEMDDRGVVVVPGWPATVPRLLAVVARHEGDLAGARRFLEHALNLVERERLPAERARVLLERARVDGPAGARPADVAATIVEASRAFDGLSMHGWVARCDEVAQALGVPVAAAAGTTRERTIFTDDVVGSTAANVRLGDALYLEQLRLHDRLVRARLGEFRGLEIKHTGDGLNAAFDDPDDAVQCALSALDDVRRWRRDEPDLALHIRCGLARGPVIASDGDFFGLVQSQAARLCDLASPGELLATGEVIAGIRAGVDLEALGPTSLRGLPGPIEVFRVAAR